MHVSDHAANLFNVPLDPLDLPDPVEELAKRFDSVAPLKMSISRTASTKPSPWVMTVYGVLEGHVDVLSGNGKC